MTKELSNLDFGAELDGEYQLLTAEHDLRGHALRAVVYIEEPTTVYDDPPDSGGATGRREPYDQFYNGQEPRVARTVVVNRPRFLVRATDQHERLEQLKGSLSQATEQLNQVKRKLSSAEKQAQEQEAMKLEAQGQLRDAKAQLQASQRERERLDLLITASEDRVARLRTVLGDELMDAVLDTAKTLDAAALKRRAMEALGTEDE